MTNAKRGKALITGEYRCEKCNTLMEFADEYTLYCPQCHKEVPFEEYGMTQEEIDNQYPTKEDICGYDESEDGCGEIYDDPYDE